MVKIIQLTFSDEEYFLLKKAKQENTWRTFMLQSAQDIIDSVNLTADEIAQNNLEKIAKKGKIKIIKK